MKKKTCRERENRRYKESKTGGKTGREEENKQRVIQVEGNTGRVNTCRGRSKKRKKGQNVISKSSWRT